MTSKTHVVRGTNERTCDRTFVHIAYIQKEIHNDRYFAASLIKRYPLNSVFLATAYKMEEL